MNDKNIQQTLSSPAVECNQTKKLLYSSLSETEKIKQGKDHLKYMPLFFSGPLSLASDGSRIFGHNNLWSNLVWQLLYSHKFHYLSKTRAELYSSLNHFLCLLLQRATGQAPFTISCFLQTISKCKTNSLSTIHIQANSMETKESFLIILVLCINNEDTKDYTENFSCDLVSSNNS